MSSCCIRQNSFIECSFENMGMKIEMKTSGLFHDRFPYVSHLYEVPLLRNVTILALICIFAGLIGNITRLCLNWDVVEMVRNGFLLVLTSFAVHISFLSLTSKARFLSVLKLKGELWSCEDAGAELKNKIRKDIHLLQYQRIFTTIVCMLTVFILPFSGDVREMFGLLYLYKDVTKKFWFKYMYYSLKVLQAFISAAFPSPCFMLIYSISDCTYALMVMRERLQLVERTFGRKDVWFYEIAYQKYVEMMLKSCIRQHVLIKRYHRVIARTIENSLVVAFLTAVSLFAFFYFNVVMHLSAAVLLKYFIMILLMFIFTYNYCLIGQNLKDECENLYQDLCACPWFLWSKSNKNLYLMFLVHAREPLVFESVDIYLNRTIFVQMIRTTASLLTAIRQMANL